MSVALTAHPALSLPRARLTLLLVAVLRTIFAVGFIAAFDAWIDFGTAPAALGLGAAMGVTGATVLAFRPLSTRAFFALLGGAWLAVVALFESANWLFGFIRPGFFGVHNISVHASLTTLFLTLAALSTWAFWRWRHWLVIESVALTAACLQVLAAHRNFRFDTPQNTPQVVNTIAWFLRVDHLTVLVGLGALLLGLLVAYLTIATLPTRPVPTTGRLRRASSSRTGLGAWSGAAAMFSLVVYLVAAGVYYHYAGIVESRTANGVGMTAEEGMSPLSFHSALGSTNQPSALVRLDGDYTANPFTPMLYLREAALSSFNGREFVRAPRTRDRDVAETLPDEHYSGDEDPDLPNRTPLVQSVYLLAEHKHAFGIDYPLTIKPLRLTNQARFKAAFRVDSVAPTFTLAELRDDTPGDPRWNEEERAHYLELHPDPRYQEKALELSGEAIMPVEKAAAIVTWLSKNAIYTLTPNHNVEPADDPVAAFLFGDLRGYCVHFAHATVYMLRALGIPSRVATGYLTDLSQSKDGHILLRMSDRHAWAEVYLAGRGWVPFDTQPDQVESHGDSQVDMKLLEELMSSLEPGEEILPKDVARDEENVTETSPLENLHAADLIWPVAAVLLALLAIKLYLRFGWLLPGSADARLRRACIGIISTLRDLGYQRGQGETRSEFRHRLSRELGAPTLTLTEPLTVATYAPDGRTPEVSITSLRQRDLAALAGLPRWRRIVGALNPASVFSALMRERW